MQQPALLAALQPRQGRGSAADEGAWAALRQRALHANSAGRPTPILLVADSASFTSIQVQLACCVELLLSDQHGAPVVVARFASGEIVELLSQLQAADFFKDYNKDGLECILSKLADEPDGRAHNIRWSSLSVF